MTSKTEIEGTFVDSVNIKELGLADNLNIVRKDIESMERNRENMIMKLEKNKL